MRSKDTDRQGSVIVTHVGDGVQETSGRFSTLIGRVGLANKAVAANVGRGTSTESLGVAQQPRKLRSLSAAALEDEVTEEEICEVRRRCKRMMVASEAAGGTSSPANAREALLTAVFEAHPDLDGRDLDNYMAVRGLEPAEEVDPERIRELAVALFLLSRRRPLTFDGVVRVAYTIFDEDGDGEIDRKEFQRLMKATLRTHLTLEFVLRLPAGKEAFLRHLKDEYAEENFYFWQSSDQFASSIPTLAKAQTLYDGYIREGAPKQVNISASTRKGIREKWQAVQHGEAPLTRKLFSKAQDEVFHLMYRDNFGRFQKSAKSMEDFVNCMFKEVDRSHDGTISLSEYMEWATKNRDVMRFMRATGGEVAVIRRLSSSRNPLGAKTSLVAIEVRFCCFAVGGTRSLAALSSMLSLLR
ncbi:similar to regulator of G-protein signaling 7 [Ectocarpus siliculosus]|uniref:Similar to regulator of G-protein signaling 7 n=1 Tax=Ectocarpus siliculosus TaxID=2880 RepID=D8LJT8_ECTSI|nr:similar to regulator of G-protein signaling 7 [Ectocarpus siliculosus]|eukprot:CBN79604.1 similar to regulator of G-protein signaling 7 [Ectocarpus siliculosus]